MSPLRTGLTASVISTLMLSRCRFGGVCHEMRERFGQRHFIAQDFRKVVRQIRFDRCRH